MPSTSPKQERFMTAVAKNPEFAKKVKVPQSVGQEFHEADMAKQRSMARAVRQPRSSY